MNHSSVVRSSRVGPQATVTPAEARQARAGVQQADEARPRAVEVRSEQQRRVVSDDAIGRVRPVDPVRIHADHRIVDVGERVDRVRGRREEVVDHVRIVTEMAERSR